MSLYSTGSNCQNLHQESKKMLGTNMFMRTKSHTGSQFSQISLGLLCI